MAWRKFSVGEEVRIPEENRRGIITDIRSGWWEDRWGKKWRHRWYRVPSPSSGTPSEWYLAIQLAKKDDPVIGEIIGL